MLQWEFCEGNFIGNFGLKSVYKIQFTFGIKCQNIKCLNVE